MNLNYKVLKVIATAFGIFTFAWMLFDYFENTKDVNLNYNKANQAFIKKKYEEAYNFYELALKDDPENLYFLEGKARSLFRMNDFNKSEKIFQEVIQKDNNFVAAIANLGILYDTLVNYELAIKYYELAFSKDSKVTAGMPWFKRFLKNIHFKPSSVEERLIYLKNNFNTGSRDKNLKNTDIDKLQPDFQM
mgnify:CR=1 FL=1